MKKVLVLLVVLALLPALAQGATTYRNNWYDGFDNYNIGAYEVGNLSGQNGWITTENTATTFTDVGLQVSTAKAYDGAKSIKIQKTTSGVHAERDMTVLNAGGGYYTAGWVKYWFWDPGTNSVNTDVKLGVYGQNGTQPASDNACITAMGIIDAKSKAYYCAQWSADAQAMNGTTNQIPITDPANTTGFAWKSPNAAPRINGGAGGWAYGIMTWNTSPSGGWFSWRINQTAVENMRVDFDSTASRGAIGKRFNNTYRVTGLFIGSLFNTQNDVYVDKIEFHGNAVPEPSALLALGTGLIGIAGVIRRRK